MHDHVFEEPAAAGQSQPETGPTAWHQALLNYLKTEESVLWNWFTSSQARTEAVESERLQLLKTAYRIDPESAADLYQSARQAAEKLQIQDPLTLYQAQQSSDLNATLAWLPQQVHIILHGPVQETLTDDELAAVLVHELAHYEFYLLADGQYRTVEQILSAMLQDRNAQPAHLRTWRTYRLYTELYCDRRAAQITGDPEACLRGLVKLHTGLKEVSAAAYFRQADEILSGDVSASSGVTHPELFIRAKALQLWDAAADVTRDQLAPLIEGPLSFEELDLLKQQQLTAMTRRFLHAFLSPVWLQTPLIRDHAKRFFDDFEFAAGTATRPAQPAAAAHPTAGLLKAELQRCDAELRNYFGYLLLDFITCDADLDEAPLAAAFVFCEQTGLTDEFRQLVEKELKPGKRVLQRVQDQARQIVNQAEKEFAKV